MPANSKLYQHPDKECWVLTLDDHTDEEKSKALNQEIIRFPNHNNDFVPLKPAMSLLRAKGIKSLMVEGGARVLTEFLKAGLADAIVMTMAPKILGGYKAIGDLELKDYLLSPSISPLNFEKLEEDLIVWGDLHYGEVK